MRKTITMSGSSSVELGTDSSTYYEDYWKEGDVVSEGTWRRNQAVLDTCFPEGIKGRRILEIGVGGEGGMLLALAQDNEVHGIDVSASAKRNCKRLGLEIELLNLDTDRLPFEDDSFDVAFSFEVFEHFANPQHAIEELKRVLKPQGLLVLSTPSPLVHHWPRLFYPELFEEQSFREFLMINRLEILKRLGWGENRYKHLIPEKHLKVWNWIWLCNNMRNEKPAVLLEYGRYFWEQRDALGIRKKPMEAIDLLRAVCQRDGSLLEARGMLAMALVYRFINGEQEEFLQNVHYLIDGANGKQHPQNMLATYYLVSTCLELKRFGISLLGQGQLAERIRDLSGLPGSEPYVKNLAEGCA
jgi:ubiquinone/menaquinone biosynthesis C-methylase UbiE